MQTPSAPTADDRLTPEEDAIDDPDDAADQIDDTLPADLWFVAGRARSHFRTGDGTGRKSARAPALARRRTGGDRP